MTDYGIHGWEHIQSLAIITSYSSIWPLLCTHMNQTLAHQNACFNHPRYVLNASSTFTTFIYNVTNFIHVQLSTKLCLPQSQNTVPSAAQYNWLVTEHPYEENQHPRWCIPHWSNSVKSLMMVDNCCPCNSWQFVLFNWLFFRSVMFL